MQRPKTPWWVLVFAVPFILLMADLGPTQQTLQNMSSTRQLQSSVGLQLPTTTIPAGSATTASFAPF